MSVYTISNIESVSMTEKECKNNVHKKYYTLQTSSGTIKISDVGMTNLFQRCLDMGGKISFVYVLHENPSVLGLELNPTCLQFGNFVVHSAVKKRTYIAAVTVEDNPYWNHRPAFIFVDGKQVI